MNEKLHTIALVLKNRNYAMIATLTSLGLGGLYYFLTLSLLQNHLQAELLISPAYIVTSIALTAAIAVLAGINVSLIIFKIKLLK